MKLTPINNWRSQFNPLRGLNMQRLAALLEFGDWGQYADLQWLYRYIEKRYAILSTGIERRESALSKLDWAIKIKEEAANDPSAQAQADALRELYNGIANLKEAIKFLALAKFRGYSHLQKILDSTGKIVRLDSIPQWHWVRDGIYGEWLFDQNASGTLSLGQKVDFDELIIRECARPINEIASISFVRSSMSQKDWDGFVETYGIPPLFAEMPPAVPPDQEPKYMALAEAVVSDARGVVPNGTKMQTVDVGARGTNPFKEHLSYQDSLVVLVMTGGKLTMLNEPTGMGGGQADVHAAVFAELAEADAADTSELFNDGIDTPYLAAKFPGQQPLAYFELSAKDRTDINALADQTVKFAQAGFEMDSAELSEKTGYTLHKITPIAAPLTHRALMNQVGGNTIVSSFQHDMSPLRDEIVAALKAGTPQALQALRLRLPSLTKSITKNPVLARELCRAMDKKIQET